MKKNCWEFMKCGRAVNTEAGSTEKTCPASIARNLDGIHGGKNAGRSCWVVSGTLCKGRVQGTYAEKMGNCILCDFYRHVKNEEKESFHLPSELIDILLENRRFS